MFLHRWLARSARRQAIRRGPAIRLNRLDDRITPSAAYHVNSFITGPQNLAAIAADGAGNFVVTWESNGQDGDGSGVYARRYTAAGVPLGNEFRVNQTTVGDQRSPAIGMNAAGRFVITWTNADATLGGDVYARVFNADGTPATDEFIATSETIGSQTDAVVAVAANGSFVIAFVDGARDGDGPGIFARRFGADAMPMGNDFRVNIFTTGVQDGPAIAANAGGAFVVAWQSSGQDGDGYGVFAKSYDATGTAVGTEVMVNQFTTGEQFMPAAGIDGTGEFVIAWTSGDSLDTTGQDGNRAGVFARLFEADGTAMGNEFRVNTFTTGDQFAPAVARTATGEFVIAWTSGTMSDALPETQDGSGNGVYYQTYNATGTAVGMETRVNPYVDGNQQSAAVAANAMGEFIVAYSDFGTLDPLGGIYFRQFNRQSRQFILFNGGFLWSYDGMTWADVASGIRQTGEAIRGFDGISYAPVITNADQMVIYGGPTPLTPTFDTVQDAVAGPAGIYVTFTGGFVWRFEPRTGAWTDIAGSVAAVSTGQDEFGREVIAVRFNNGGAWAYVPEDDLWLNIADNVAQYEAGPAGIYGVRFANGGVWSFDSVAGIWDDVTGSSDAIDFTLGTTAQGTWQFNVVFSQLNGFLWKNTPAGWTGLTSAVAALSRPSAGLTYVLFTDNGLWTVNDSQQWQSLASDVI